VRVKEERNILHTIKRNAYWIGHIFRRNCFLKHVIEGKIGKNRSDGNWMILRKGEDTGN